MADWEWWFTSEWGRDNMLRDQVEDARASASAASAASARLRSQLSRLEGSLESRLVALTSAFDAYVELGDVREQLLAHTDTSAVRRRVRDAVKAMTEGEHPDPVVDDETDYWLAPAANAVIAIVGGGSDPAAEALAEQRLPQARLFVVAAAGALGHGAAVADRVPALFDGLDDPDGSADPTGLDPALQTVFAAVTLGVYPSVLPHLAGRFAPSLAAVEVGDTTDWIGDRAGSDDPRERLDWVDALLDGGQPPALADDRARARPVAADRDRRTDQGSESTSSEVDFRAPDAVIRDRLRAIVVEMIEAGTGSEAALLRRSRVLRARIESPGTVMSDQKEMTGQQGLTGQDEAQEVRIPVAVAVREQLLEVPASSPERAELVRWLLPALTSAVEVLGAPHEREAPFSTVRTAGGSIEVGPDGPDSSRRAQVLAAMTAPDPSARTKFLAAAAGTGALAVLALLVALLGQTGIAGVLLVAAVVVAVVTVRLHLAAASRRRDQAEDVARAEESISKAVRQAQERQQDDRRADDALRQTHERVRARLASGVG